MKTSLDSFGRVVIPKSLRDDFGLGAGDALEIKAVQGGILLRPERDGGQLTVREGVVVYEAEASGNIDRAVEDFRKSRLEEFGGT